MRFHVADRFAIQGSTTPPGTGIVAVGIAPSSEVDLVDVGGLRLGPRAIVPFSPTINAVRGFYQNPIDDTVPVDGDLAPNQRLVLQLYEKCDALVPPGPRAPAVKQAAFTVSAGVGDSAAHAQLMFRLPFSGRREAMFMLQSSIGTVADAFICVRGIRYPLRVGGQVGAACYFDEAILDDWWAGAGTFPVSQVRGNILVLNRTFYYGGGADAQEFYDELAVYAWQNSNTGDSLAVQGEACGERVQ